LSLSVTLRHRRLFLAIDVSYLRLLDTFLNVLLSFVPMLVIAPIAPTAIRAAMRRYSMAVSPVLFLGDSVLHKPRVVLAALGRELPLAGQPHRQQS
jgi:hypothetical protein